MDKNCISMAPLLSDSIVPAKHNAINDSRFKIQDSRFKKGLFD